MLLAIYLLAEMAYQTDTELDLLWNHKPINCKQSVNSNTKLQPYTKFEFGVMIIWYKNS